MPETHAYCAACADGCGANCYQSYNSGMVGCSGCTNVCGSSCTDICTSCKGGCHATCLGKCTSFCKQVVLSS